MSINNRKAERAEGIQLSLPFDCASDLQRVQPRESLRESFISEPAGVCGGAWYWSSTRNNNAWIFRPSDSNVNNNDISNNNRARCVRSQLRQPLAKQIGQIEKPSELVVPVANYDVTLEEVFSAYFSCRKNKRNKPESRNFEVELERNLIELYEEIKDGTYQPMPSNVFIVTHPKPREIWAAQFRDRVVHHLIYNRLLEFYQRRFIYDSFACLPEKGVHKAVARAGYFCRRESDNWQKKVHYGQFDMASFFPSIHLPTLWKILERDGVLVNDEFRFLIGKAAKLLNDSVLTIPSTRKCHKLIQCHNLLLVVTIVICVAICAVPCNPCF